MKCKWSKLAFWKGTSDYIINILMVRIAEYAQYVVLCSKQNNLDDIWTLDWSSFVFSMDLDHTAGVYIFQKNHFFSPAREARRRLFKVINRRAKRARIF